MTGPGAPSDVVPYDGRHSEDDLELFGPYRALYRIEIEGHAHLVPEDNVVLRCMQYVEMYTRTVRMPWRDYCWNNTVGCCEMTYRDGPGAPEKKGRACIVAAKPGMQIVRLPKGGRTCTPRR
ncbi:hypothetical protein L6R52_37255 [Myxococcota bacterium]|nr:hypothetical protein [Myxococcota bacterium]